MASPAWRGRNGDCYTETDPQRAEAVELAKAGDVEGFIKSDYVQRKISDCIRNCTELYVAEQLGIPRRDARAALKLTGRW
jgi:hypothetical protein